MQTQNQQVINLSEQQVLQGISTFCLLGSVAAGKTTLVKLLTGNTTQKLQKELLNGCTINMGYETLKIYYKDVNSPFLLNPKLNEITDGYRLIRHFSIADNPGHNSFMATLVTGTSNIDSAIFVIAANKGIEPQTLQHMKCFNSTNVNNLAIVVTKVDLIPTDALLQDVIDLIDPFIDNELSNDEIDPCTIPISTVSKVNTDYIIKYLVRTPYPRNIISINF